ncbi:MAG: M20 family metallopeptidase [Bacteroidota bacterium]
MLPIKTEIQAQAQELFPEVLGHRRHLHMHPELSFKEEQTAAYVASQLQEMGIPYQKGIGGHGIVAHIEGEQGKGKLLALRADMDALPIQEENEVPYASTQPGIMHACGHDVHTASLLGVAKILVSQQSKFAGTFRLLFQPAEERLPGGASLMIRDGALQSPQVESILGQHVLPYIDAGKVGIRPGVYMASADEIYLTIKGKGGHAASPQLCVDPVTIGAQIIASLQQVISRADPREPSVLSFGRFIAEGATNVIPDEVHIAGTFRAMNETWRKEAHTKIRSIVEGTATAFGAEADLDIRVGYPVLKNNETLTNRIRKYMSAYVGEENIVDLGLWLGAEDFAYYTHEVPGCFYRLGTRNKAKGITHGLHTPKFNIDESTLELSIGLMSWLALNELGVG